MTKFWPASAIGARLRPEQKWELENFRRNGISERTLQACHEVASQMQGCDITMLHTEGVSLKRVYLKHPTRENWLSLERYIFIDTGDNFGFNVETLH